MRTCLLDIAVSPVEELLYAIDDNMSFIVILLLFFLVLSSVLVTVFVTKNKQKSEKDDHGTDEYNKE